MTVDFTINSFIAAKVETSFHIGIIVAINEDENTISVNFMKRKGEFNSFCWPKPRKIEEIPFKDVLSTVTSIKLKRGIIYALSKAEFKRLQELNIPDQTE